MTRLLYQGHGSFRLVTDAGAVIYIDPFAGEGYELPADLILVTHQHFDHNQIALPAQKPGCVIYQNTDALMGGTWQEVQLAGCTVRATQACNSNHPIDECVGYLVGTGKLLLYFAGDTSRTEQMSELARLGIDYAFLPCDGIYNMDVAGASACAELIDARHSTPVHTAPMSPKGGKAYDPAVAQRFTAPNVFLIEPGTEREL